MDGWWQVLVLVLLRVLRWKVLVVARASAFTAATAPWRLSTKHWAFGSGPPLTNGEGREGWEGREDAVVDGRRGERGERRGGEQAGS